MLIDGDFQDTEDLDGLFSGYNPETRQYDTKSWQYQGHEMASTGTDEPINEAPETAGQVGQGGGQAAQHAAPGARNQLP